MIRRFLPNYQYNPNIADEEYTKAPVFTNGGIHIRDDRNNAYGVDINLHSSQCYINYLEYLDYFKDQWKIFGYLDLGYVPLAMGPGGLIDFVRLYGLELCKQYSIEHVACKPIRFLQGGYMQNDEDIWVKREDLIRVSGYTGNPMAFSVIHFHKKEEVRAVWKKLYGI